MKSRYFILAALAFALVLGMGISPAMAYFTDTDAANGGLEVKVTPSTEIYETWADNKKSIVITNDETATTPVFVRAKSDAPAILKQKVSGEGWTDGGDGWWYYGTNPGALTPVEPGGETSPLIAELSLPKVQTDEPAEGAVELGTEYNVVVLYESVPAIYNADGSTNPNDWQYILDSGN